MFPAAFDDPLSLDVGESSSPITHWWADKLSTQLLSSQSAGLRHWFSYDHFPASKEQAELLRLFLTSHSFTFNQQHYGSNQAAVGYLPHISFVQKMAGALGSGSMTRDAHGTYSSADRQHVVELFLSLWVHRAAMFSRTGAPDLVAMVEASRHEEHAAAAKRLLQIELKHLLEVVEEELVAEHQSHSSSSGTAAHEVNLAELQRLHTAASEGGVRFSFHGE